MRSAALVPFMFAVWLACDGASGDATEGEDSQGETDSDDTNSGPPDFEAEIQPIFESACLCHFMPPAGGEMEADYLTLNLGTGLGQLVNVDSEQVPTMKRVAPGDVANSYLIHKVRNTHLSVGAPADADPMPPNQMLKLTETQIATLEAWIEAGAQG